jgi:EAL domain-containing protein (putative c-di-GMP-specific phosphodiesterase class I)
LAQLHRTPVSELKIDRSFVKQMTGASSVTTVIVDTILKLARAIGLRTVAEGVESTEQREQLQELGCDLFQGHLASKPIPAHAVLYYIDTFGPPKAAPR